MGPSGWCLVRDHQGCRYRLCTCACHPPTWTADCDERARAAVASRTVTVMTDDLDGGEATQTVAFSLDGTAYEIDLDDDHARDLRDALALYVAHARRVGGRAPQRTAPPASGDDAGSATAAAGPSSSGAGAAGPDPRAVRAWAVENGIAVPSRGRVPAAVVARYQAR